MRIFIFFFTDYNELIKSCDIGLSTVILKKDLLKNNILFPGLKTKEDYVLWLKITREGQKISGYDKTLSEWRKCDSSLSSSTFFWASSNTLYILILESIFFKSAGPKSKV